MINNEEPESKKLSNEISIFDHRRGRTVVPFYLPSFSFHRRNRHSTTTTTKKTVMEQ
jgi:hypothetical protein